MADLAEVEVEVVESRQGIQEEMVVLAVEVEAVLQLEQVG